MILVQLRSHLAQQRRLSLRDLATRFDAEPDAMRGMLATLERKGYVRKLPAGSVCGTCGQCDQATPELYEWIEP